ncbi:class I SAM-dependent rRNA methyltransferase [Marispirochaeta aestuarii]|uniref:class I SAM-dependent rRNA methyltransferase n=1 Tax=Marispirochaeta aestuarii TaxID=1963862 RepID=UPI0029C63C1E|nr:class I SAM-dependent rRNA methyltransferase [Marispirochaeta aestuarii]
MNYSTVVLKRGKESSLKRLHPWIFSGAIARTESEPAIGDPVQIRGADNTLLGTGLWEGGSIAVRIMSFAGDLIDEELFFQRISTAWRLRQDLGLTESRETNAFRLVHGDGDGLPGLIIDWYDGHAVVQAHSYGIYRLGDTVAQTLARVTGKRLKLVYDKSGNCLGGRRLPAIENRYLFCRENPVAEWDVLESGHRFHVNWEEGQKTGFFLDQRENRRHVQSLARGRKVLNAFSYSGGFSVYALKGAAEKVLSVDSSAHAVGMLERNITDNSIGENHETLQSEVMPVLKERGRDFDFIILDPPAFAKHKSARHQAVQGYKRLNHEAIRAVPSGGYVMTFSCSQVVGGDLFEGAVRAAAIETGRRVQILARLSQGADHPVSIYQPEGEYLKGLLLHIR